ncbi:hypothetical protein LX32DRAFT_22106 [Colletotrichum zoysiae]|uniref:Uncharacterized protein n=1 Tax=Colletotrichum zoysiae TaxID=1216348 RepID=A0AAD9HC84_9PEZI|nr:hypothetical protein LX32DRAFT_22106 [Colletotrichum zoysiae]
MGWDEGFAGEECGWDVWFGVISGWNTEDVRDGKTVPVGRGVVVVVVVVLPGGGGLPRCFFLLFFFFCCCCCWWWFLSPPSFLFPHMVCRCRGIRRGRRDRMGVPGAKCFCSGRRERERGGGRQRALPRSRVCFSGSRSRQPPLPPGPVGEMTASRKDLC